MENLEFKKYCLELAVELHKAQSNCGITVIADAKYFYKFLTEPN